MVAALTAGIIAGSSQTVFATSDNLMDAILNEEADNDEITSEETAEDYSAVPQRLTYPFSEDQYFYS